LRPRTLLRGRTGGGCPAGRLRRDLALRYLADRKLAIGEVAYLLGYSEPSPFHRAFRRWTGLTPSEARRRAA
jgi:AraC-like DNA-binding protein